MGCKFGYIEKAFGESNPELAEKLNKEHEDIIRGLLASGDFELVGEKGSNERKLVKKNLPTIDEVMGLNEETQQNKGDKANTVDTKLREKYFPEGNETTDTAITDKISKSEHPLNEVAKHLLSFTKGLPVKLESKESLGESNLEGFENNGVAGEATPSGITIAEFARFKGKGSEPTILHEVLHTLTAEWLANNKDAQLYKDFENSFQEAKKALEGKTDDYALANVDEFVVALFTNAKFINDLKDIPSTTPSKYPNLLQEAFSHILSMFKVAPESSLFEDAFAMATNIIQADSEATKEEKASLEEHLKTVPPIESFEGYNHQSPGAVENLPEGVTVDKNGEVSVNVITDSVINKLQKESPKLQEGFEGVDTSRIIYFEGNSGGELKMNLDSDAPQAEVLIPSKFKDSNGKLVDLFEGYDKKKGEGKYITTTGGNLTLKEDMFDSELLENFMFRIPTSSHGLGSSIKIVGFLPPESGDLAITPKNFIVKMGQDFDVDKLTAYQYHHTVNKDGKLEIVNEKTKEDSSAHLKKNLDTIMKLPASVERDAKIEKLGEKIHKAETKVRKKILQNNIIRTHITVFKSTNKDIQKNIHKVLSMDTAEKHAGAIDQVNPSSQNFDFLSPNYQMHKMNLGSTGATGIGIYAKGVTFHSLVQQNLKKLSFSPIKIGGTYSDGTLGLQNALVKSNATEYERYRARQIAEILDEKTNTATDNEKAQILGRVGLNYKETIGVDALLSMLGFDLEITEIEKDDYKEDNPFHNKTTFKGKPIYYTEYSLPYMLHSQPIIKKVFEAYQSKTAKIQGSGFGLIEDDFKEFVTDYFQKVRELKTPLDESQTELSGKNLEASLKGITNPELDLNILQLYSDLLNKSTQLKDATQIVDTSDLGRSLFETVELKAKFETMMNPKKSDGGIENLSSMLGEYSSTPEQGFLKIDNGFYFKSTSNQGRMLGNATSLGYVFDPLFPFDEPNLKRAFNNILLDMGIKAEASISKRATAKEHLFQEMKKFITAANVNGLFENSSETRKELFFDYVGNMSLSTYLGDAFSKTIEEEFEKGVLKVRQNKLLSTLEYTKGFRGKPSLVKFSPGNAEGIDEEYYTQAFAELIINDTPLPPKNGKPYSTRLLANDLIAYSFSSGGIVSGAVEFHKFIPLAYLDDLQTEIKGGKKVSVTEILRLQNSGWANKVFRFKTQYFQNNPDKATKLSSSKVIKNTSEKGVRLISFNLGKDVSDYPPFAVMSIDSESNLKRDKNILLKHRTGTDSYEQIPIVGEHGMSEYVFESNQVKKSSVLSKEELSEIEVTKINEATLALNKARIQSEEMKNKVVPFGLTTDKPVTIKDIFNSIGKSSTVQSDAYLSDLARILINFASPNLKVEIIDDVEQNFEGKSSLINNQEVITLNLAYLRGKKNKYVAETVLHEFVHSVTSTQMNAYYDSETGTFSKDTPKELRSLMHVYEDYTAKIKKKYPTEYKLFIERYNKNKNNNLPSDTELTQLERDAFYATVDIKEFLATVLGNSSGFRKHTAGMSYAKTNVNIMTRFGKIIVDLFARLGKGKKIDVSLLEESLFRSLEAVEYLNNKKIKDFNLIPRKVESKKTITNEDRTSITDLFNSAMDDFHEENQSGAMYEDQMQNLEDLC